MMGSRILPKRENAYCGWYSWPILVLHRVEMGWRAVIRNMTTEHSARDADEEFASARVDPLPARRFSVCGCVLVIGLLMMRPKRRGFYVQRYRSVQAAPLSSAGKTVCQILPSRRHADHNSLMT